MTLDQYIDRVYHCTQDNQHTESIRLIAEYVTKKHSSLAGVQKLVKQVEAIETLYDFYKHMPPQLNDIKNHLRNAVFSFLDDEETRRFNSVM